MLPLPFPFSAIAREDTLYKGGNRLQGSCGDFKSCTRKQVVQDRPINFAFFKKLILRRCLRFSLSHRSTLYFEDVTDVKDVAGREGRGVSGIYLGLG